MTTWIYHKPQGRADLPPAVLHLEPSLVETLGTRQAELLLRARKSEGGILVLTHERSSNRDRMAARRLVERGLLSGPNWTGSIRNWRGQQLARNFTGLYVYTLTSRGRTAWLRVKEAG